MNLAKVTLGSFALAALSGIGASQFALGEEPLNVVTDTKASCYKETKTHFHNLATGFDGAPQKPTPIGAAYFSVQNGYSYAVIDNGSQSEGSTSGVAESLKSYFSASDQSDFMDCGSVKRCGGGKASVCVLKISDQGSFLPVRHAGPIRVTSHQTSSVEFNPDNGHLHIQETPELYDSLSNLPTQNLRNPDGSGPSYLSSYLEKKSPQMSCSKKGITLPSKDGVHTSFDQTCDFNLSTIAGMTDGTAPRDAVMQVPLLPLSINAAARGDKGSGSPTLPDARIFDTVAGKQGSGSKGTFVCPTGSVCDDPNAHSSPGDQGYGSAH
jgi:hypothetical protein